MGVGLEGVGSGDVVGGVELDDDADAAAGVDVGGDHALVAGEAADLDVLADDQDLLLQQGVHGEVGALGLALEQGVYVGGVLGHDGVGAGLDEGLELGVLGHEVGLGVDLDDHGHLAAVADSGESHALGGDTAGLLDRGGQALLPEEVDGLVHIALSLGEGLFAVHHAAAGLFPEGGNVFSGKIHLLYPLSFILWQLRVAQLLCLGLVGDGT